MNRTGTAALSFFSAVMVVALVACTSNSSQPTKAPSVGTTPSAEKAAPDGATLLETRCSVCHSAAKPKAAKKTREQWDTTVTRMVGKGAQLTEAEKKVLVEYLAETAKP